MSTETMVKKIADLLGLNSLQQIREALGVPEQKKLVDPVVVDWQAEFEAATTFDEYMKVYYGSPCASALEMKALERAQGLLELKLASATTAEECLYVFSNTSRTNGNRLWKKAAEKIDDLFRPKLEAATTIDECWEIWRHLPDVSELKTETLRKALSLATTIDECLEISVLTSLGDIPAEAVKKALGLATTVEECMEVYDGCPSELESDALEKVHSLLRPRLEASTTVYDCLEVYNDAPPEGAFLGQILEKAFGLATTVDELKMIFKAVEFNSTEAHICICKIEQLLSAESAQ